jgi:hypothetical protein
MLNDSTDRIVSEIIDEAIALEPEAREIHHKRERFPLYVDGVVVTLCPPGNAEGCTLETPEWRAINMKRASLAARGYNGPLEVSSENHT